MAGGIQFANTIEEADRRVALRMLTRFRFPLARFNIQAPSSQWPYIPLSAIDTDRVGHQSKVGELSNSSFETGGLSALLCSSRAWCGGRTRCDHHVAQVHLTQAPWYRRQSTGGT